MNYEHENKISYIFYRHNSKSLLYYTELLTKIIGNFLQLKFARHYLRAYSKENPQWMKHHVYYQYNLDCIPSGN